MASTLKSLNQRLEQVKTILKRNLPGDPDPSNALIISMLLGSVIQVAYLSYYFGCQRCLDQGLAQGLEQGRSKFFNEGYYHALDLIQQGFRVDDLLWC